MTVDWSPYTSGSGRTSNIGRNNMSLYKLAKFGSIRRRKREASVGSVAVCKAVTSKMVGTADRMTSTRSWWASCVGEQFPDLKVATFHGCLDLRDDSWVGGNLLARRIWDSRRRCWGTARDCRYQETRARLWTSGWGRGCSWRSNRNRR